MASVINLTEDTFLNRIVFGRFSITIRETEASLQEMVAKFQHFSW